jgi:hypothetical protein
MARRAGERVPRTPEAEPESVVLSSAEETPSETDELTSEQVSAVLWSDGADAAAAETADADPVPPEPTLAAQSEEEPELAVPAVVTDVESTPVATPGPAASRAAAREPGRGVWASIPLPVRAALALALLPLTVYVVILRWPRGSGFKTSAVTTWTFILLAPFVLLHLPGASPQLPGRMPVPAVPGGPGEVAGPVAPAAASPNATAPAHKNAASASPSAAPGAATPAPGASPAPGAPAGAPSPSPNGPNQPASSPAPTSTPGGPSNQNLCGAPANPWSYTLCGGTPVTSPPSNFCSVFNCATGFNAAKVKDYVAECQDGTYTSHGGHPNACPAHGKETGPLYGP